MCVFFFTASKSESLPGSFVTLVTSCHSEMSHLSTSTSDRPLTAPVLTAPASGDTSVEAKLDCVFTKYLCVQVHVAA